VGVALLTITLKTLAWYVTGSVGLLSDAMESFVNLASAMFALAMVTVAQLPADDDHPYGHHKAEYFSSGFEGVLILVAALGIIGAAIGRLHEPQPLEAIGLGIGLYDGIFGPGTGTFAIIAFTTLMGFDLRTAGGNAKVLNLASNYASLVTYLMNGLVVFSVGIPCAVSGIVGNLLGSHFALKNGAKFIRPMMLVVLVLLLGKIVSDAVL